MDPIRQKQFIALYPTFSAFSLKVILPLSAEFDPTGRNIPMWADDNFMYYKWRKIYNALEHRYGEWFCINGEERTHKLMINALTALLPMLYWKSQILRNETLKKYSLEALLRVDTRRYNENPDVNFAVRETTESSTPSTTIGAKTFDNEAVANKTLTATKDKTVSVTELSDALERINALTMTPLYGYLNDIINSAEIASLWEVIDLRRARNIVIEQINPSSPSTGYLDDTALVQAELRYGIVDASPDPDSLDDTALARAERRYNLG